MSYQGPILTQLPDFANGKFIPGAKPETDLPLWSGNVPPPPVGAVVICADRKGTRCKVTGYRVDESGDGWRWLMVVGVRLSDGFKGDLAGLEILRTEPQAMTRTTLNTHAPQIADELERAIAAAIVEDALRLGYAIAVHEGEAFALRASTDGQAIMGALASTDMDRLDFIRDGKRVGWVLLIYGNGDGLISDSTENDATDAVLINALNYADQHA